MANKHHVVIVGGGFGGLYAARKLKSDNIQVTLIDKRNFHLFQPLLYQVATGALSPADIASPLRNVFKRHKNVRVLMGEVVGFDPDKQQVILSDGRIGYDSLILAAGSSHHYFGKDWRDKAPGLKTIENATAIRSRILKSFEAAEFESDPDRVKALMTFVIVGAGPTGVELAGAMREIAVDTLRSDFRQIDTSSTRIILVEGSNRVLPVYPEKLSTEAEKMLKSKHIDVRTNTMLTQIEDEFVILKNNDNRQKIITRNVFWAAGVKANPLGCKLAEKSGAECDNTGKVRVTDRCELPGYENIFVIGDLAYLEDSDGQPLPGVAQVAIQQGKYVAKLIMYRLKGENKKPFKYRDYGSMSTLGRAAAVVDFGFIKFAGFFAWVLWLFIHLMKIVGFQNRLLVFVQWAWNYITHSRSARIITGSYANSSLNISNYNFEKCMILDEINQSAGKKDRETRQV